MGQRLSGALRAPSTLFFGYRGACSLRSSTLCYGGALPPCKPDTLDSSRGGLRSGRPAPSATAFQRPPISVHIIPRRRRVYLTPAFWSVPSLPLIELRFLVLSVSRCPALRYSAAECRARRGECPKVSLLRVVRGLAVTGCVRGSSPRLAPAWRFVGLRCSVVGGFFPAYAGAELASLGARGRSPCFIPSPVLPLLRAGCARAPPPLAPLSLSGVGFPPPCGRVCPAPLGESGCRYAPLFFRLPRCPQAQSSPLTRGH